MTLAYITCKDKEEAERISTHLLKKRFIACANIFPISSMFWWKEEIQKSREFVVIAKSEEKLFGKIEEEVKRIHSYEIPCILKIDADSNKDFDEWVKDVIGGGKKGIK